MHACIRKFAGKDDEKRVMLNVGDIVYWQCGTLGLWDVQDVECSECGMFWMRDVGDVGCSVCGMLRILYSSFSLS